MYIIAKAVPSFNVGMHDMAFTIVQIHIYVFAKAGPSFNVRMHDILLTRITLCRYNAMPLRDEVYKEWKDDQLHQIVQAPFGKMVRKGFARLVVQDCLREGQSSHAAASTSEPSAALLGNAAAEESSLFPKRDQGSDGGVQDMSGENELKNGSTGGEAGQHLNASEERGTDSLSRLRNLLEDRGSTVSSDVLDKELEQAAVAASAVQYDRMAAPGTLLGKECGNMYAASVHASLASLVYEKRSNLEGNRILASSFGSGLAASIFCIRAKHVEGPYSLESIAKKVSLVNSFQQLTCAAFKHRLSTELYWSPIEKDAIQGQAGSENGQ